MPLRVISRTSVMRYQDTNKPIAQIARELGVEGIIEGSVARAGKRVTVTVQLIDATEDTHLWAHRYDRDAEDLLEIEGEVSQEISNQIGGTLGLRRGTNAATAHRIDPEVYDLYLLGRYHRNKRTAADLTKALDFFQQSIDRDPRYAPAYAGLASVYGILPHYQSVDVQDTQRKAEAAARHALELDDDLAEAHATLGLLDVVNGAPEQAPGEFRRALELNPSDATAHQWYAYYFLFSNQPNEALQEMELARRLDPLSAIINADEGQFLYGARRYEAAKARLREAIELAPELAQPHETLGLIEMAEGRSAEAMSEARVGLRLDPDDPRTMGEAGYVLAKGGQVHVARTLLAELNGKLQRGSGFPTYAAFIYVGLGEREKALQTLEKMAKERPASLSGLPQLTVLDELKDDPRYRKLCTEAQQMKY
ncbi:MAG TPA: hypothetical protein VJV74_06515 [Terriglobia bacterium]|nr:hypothetical protein [Terriglobia bacterium]